MQPVPTLVRETHADAQDRHRRAERAAFWTCLAAMVVVGLPVAVLVSPVVVAVMVLSTDVLSLVAPVPVPDLGGVTALSLALLAPGVGVMAAAWLGVRRLARRSGADALVLASGARPPLPGDLTERRLVNLVEEVALAAGVLPPRVVVLDADVANAAVVGTSIDDATLVVPRGLLDALGRDATGAVVADLLVMARAGDLGLALTIGSALETLDVVGAALAAPTSRRTRRALWRFARLAARPDRTGADGRRQVAEEAEFLAGELAALARGEATPEPAHGLVMGLVTLPFLVASLAFTLLRLGPGALLVDPALAMMWRRRRLLADATAVELTRDPSALAEALAALDADPGPAPAGPWAHLFAVAPDPAVPPPSRPGPSHPGPDHGRLYDDGRPYDDGRLYDDGGYGRDWMRRPTALGRVRLACGRAAGRVAAGRWAGAPARTWGGSAQAELATFVPSLAERLACLRAMGAGADPADPWRLGTALTWIGRVAGAMAALAAGLVLVYVTLVIDALVLAPPTALLHAALR
jgi:Zn-dependent protease with chaperone function